MVLSLISNIHFSAGFVFNKPNLSRVCVSELIKKNMLAMTKTSKSLNMSYDQMDEDVRRARDKWRKELKKECDILLEGKTVKLRGF